MGRRRRGRLRARRGCGRSRGSRSWSRCGTRRCRRRSGLGPGPILIPPLIRVSALILLLTLLVRRARNRSRVPALRGWRSGRWRRWALGGIGSLRTLAIARALVTLLRIGALRPRGRLVPILALGLAALGRSLARLGRCRLLGRLALFLLPLLLRALLLRTLLLRTLLLRTLFLGTLLLAPAGRCGRFLVRIGGAGRTRGVGGLASLAAALGTLRAAAFLVRALAPLAALLTWRSLLVLSLRSLSCPGRLLWLVTRIGLGYRDGDGVLRLERRRVRRQHHQRDGSARKEQVGKLHDPQFTFGV